MSEYIGVVHPFEPVWDKDSKILILGSFPSVKSREEMFYYAHPRNRFWVVLADVLSCEIPETIDDKKKMLIDNNVALWDVIASCDIIGSSDSSIKNVKPNDVDFIIKNSRITRVFTNGTTSYRLYNKYILPHTDIRATLLPSTSPANAAKNTAALISEWREKIGDETKCSI